ncbi:TonB-dependent receptor domain-containing protein [Govanella unica]|uniref:TonB-dependent receptor n=1 Tax=Govanella unica TaxID=2975056 RepID=A0A9X3TXU4_9PROT|nr:TonB-dependent receptor [Govania unica]MDA5193662.1 TonB-dependent receptor [Govania unica]
MKNTHVKVLKRLLGTTILTGGLVLATPVFADSARHYEIQPQSLASALKELANAGHIQVAFAPDVVTDLHADGLKGDFTIKQAVEGLLKNTGLTYSYDGEDVIVIRREHSSDLSGGRIRLAGAPQTAAPARAAQPRENAAFMIEEIVVTAQKRSARLQDVPLSVSAVGAEALSVQGVTDFKDILRSVPGVSFSGTDFGQSSYNIRGISTASSSPTVGVYMDDISLVTVATNFSGASDPIFFDFERLEVLKGPQGTLYGGSTMGGAIKYVSAQPKMNETHVTVAGGVSATQGGAASYEGQGIVNLPVVEDKLAVRFGALYRHLGGYIDQVADAEGIDWRNSDPDGHGGFAPRTLKSGSTWAEKNVNSSEMFVVRGSAKWQVDDSLSVIPSVFYQEYKLDNANLFRTNLPEFQQSDRLQSPTKDKLGVYGLTIDKDFGEVTFTSLTGYVNRSVSWGRDYSFFIGSLVGDLFTHNSWNDSDSSTKTFSQELRLASNHEGPWQWVAGLYYSDQKDRLIQAVDTDGSGDVFGVDTDQVYYGNTFTRMKQYAAFGELTYAITDKLSAQAGLRFFAIKQLVDVIGDGVFNGGPSSELGNVSTETGLNPKIGLNYKISDNNLAFATATKGFRPGGPNRFKFDPNLCRIDLDRLGLTDAPDSFKSDNLWNFELGSKNQFMDGKLTINGALFYTDWKKIQQTIELRNCGFNFTGNVGSAEVKGGEIEVQMVPMPGVNIGGSATYTDAKITQSDPGVSAKVGQSVLSVPKWMFNIFGSYAMPVGNDYTLTTRGEYQYHGSSLRSFESELTTNIPDDGILIVPNIAQREHSYGLANASIVLSNDVLEYRLYVNNLFNSAPYLNFTLEDAMLASTLRPRTFGFGVRAQF